MRWLSRVPFSIKAAQELVDSISEKELTDAEIPGYSWRETSSNYGGIEQRWLLVESQARKEALSDQNMKDTMQSLLSK
jgi:transposase